MRSTLLSLATLLAGALVVLFVAQRQLTGIWSAVGVRPDVEVALRQSLDDQKRLARLDPAHASEYRKRFEERQALYRRLEILRLTQREIVSRYEWIIFGVVAVTLAAASSIHFVRRNREQQRIAERMRTLDNLAAWQEAARRHAHEIRGPLTAAQLELDALAREHPGATARRESIQEELNRLREFTRSFTSFAAVPQPVLAAGDVGAFAEEFCAVFGSEWPVRCVSRSAQAMFDRALLRQVLVNLCTNAARANAATITITVREHGLEVENDGAGIAPAVRSRLFEPYTTTGQGMGLGLAISKKVLLDHGGDLQLVRTSETGTLFRLTLKGAEA